jgi:hypothetical protein
MLRKLILAFILAGTSLYAAMGSPLPLPLTRTVDTVDPKGVTHTSTVLSNGCALFKDPNPADMDRNWNCIGKQRDLYLKAKSMNDYEKMVLYAPWSSQEAWCWFHWAKHLLHGKKSNLIPNATLFRARSYCDNAVKSCGKALEVNIGTLEAKRCLRQEKKLRLYINRCLGIVPWPKGKKSREDI